MKKKKRVNISFINLNSSFTWQLQEYSYKRLSFFSLTVTHVRKLRFSKGLVSSLSKFYLCQEGFLTTRRKFALSRFLPLPRGVSFNPSTLHKGGGFLSTCRFLSTLKHFPLLLTLLILCRKILGTLVESYPSWITENFWDLPSNNEFRSPFARVQLQGSRELEAGMESQSGKGIFN